jgi:molybdopterin converting factor small subunit
MIRIRYFGQCEEAAGLREEMREVLPTTEELRKQLIRDYPDLDKLSWQFAINQKLGVEQISDGDEVALLPPFAGG